MGPTNRDAPPSSPQGRAAYAMSRIRRSPVLRACMVLAFVEYGALAMLAVFGDRLGSNGATQRGTWFPLAGWLALCSLGSWFFLFLWFPRLQYLERETEGDAGARAVQHVLEGFAVLCVGVVHGLLLWILVRVVLKG
jgi:hypothetical protein